ncbi:hypothetical protein LLG95_15925 [bacterium]|nr:hypothetical protein [bacterium]
MASTHHLLNRAVDWYARFRMGSPAAGRVETHYHGGYSFEQGADLVGRLSARFGDLSRLACVDLGSGPGESAIARQVLDIPWRNLVSVEAFPPYLEQLQHKKCAAQTHEIRAMRIEAAVAELLPHEIDIALMIDVLEHFSRARALNLLVRLQKLVRCGIVLFVPLGGVDQDELDDNPLQRHRSNWEPADLAKLGFDVEIYEKFHGQLNPPASAAWAIKEMMNDER